jgi:hypothetical protein
LLIAAASYRIGVAAGRHAVSATCIGIYGVFQDD